MVWLIVVVLPQGNTSGTFVEWFSWLATLLPPPRRTTGDIAVFEGLMKLEVVWVAGCSMLTGTILQSARTRRTADYAGNVMGHYQ